MSEVALTCEGSDQKTLLINIDPGTYSQLLNTRHGLKTGFFLRWGPLTYINHKVILPFMLHSSFAGDNSQNSEFDDFVKAATPTTNNR